MTDTAPTTTATLLNLVRALTHLLVVIVVTIWGFVDWPAPWFWLTGLGFGLFAVLIWALFLSPKPVLRTDRFGQSVIELLFLASGVGAALALGVVWWVAAALGLIAAAIGYVIISRLS